MKSILDLPIKEINDCSILLVDQEKFIKIYEYDNRHKWKNIFRGTFITNNVPPEHELPFIMILNNLSLTHQIFIFSHEYGHYLCWKNGCNCMRRKFIREAHAWKTSFKLLFKYKNYDSIFLAIDILDSYKNSKNSNFFTKCLYSMIISEKYCKDLYHKAKNLWRN